MKSILTKNQYKKFVKRNYHLDGYGQKVDMHIKVRFDDSCGNGHNTMSVTGEIYDADPPKRYIAGGCLHEEIKEVFPELASAIKFHLCSTDGPMHYMANSLYHAGDKDHYGKRKGEVSRYNTKIQFGDFPMLFDIDNALLKMIKADFDFSQAQIEKHTHPEEPDVYGSKFRIKGYENFLQTKNTSGEWYNCSHATEQELREFIECCVKYPIEIIKIPINWSKGKKLNLEAARRSAIWPEAELEDFTKENLEKRLPALLSELKNTVESLGMIY